MTSAIKDIRHTGIVVKDMPESFRFYCGLGFQAKTTARENTEFIDKVLGQKDPRLQTIKLSAPNGGMIELLDFDTEEAGTCSITAPGPTHIALTVHNIDELHKRLVGEGVKFISGPVIGKGVKVAFCQAPEGTYIELVQVLPESSFP